MVAAALALLAAAGGVAFSVSTSQRAVVAETSLNQIAEVMAAPSVVVQGDTLQGTTLSVVSGSSGTVIFPGSLPGLASDQAYQYWWIVDGAAASLAVGGGGGVAAPVFVDRQLNGGTVGITVESALGSAQPTTTPLVLLELPAA